MAFVEKYGPWALVIGASEGLGAAFADNCAARGLNVALVARRGPEMEEIAAGLRARHGIETRQIVADAAASDFLETVQAGVKGLEIGFMIFNAGLQPGGPFLRIRMEDHLKCIQIQCVAPTQVCSWLGREMAARGRGGLVLVGSGAALQGLAHWVGYSAAKAYELNLAEGLWDELRDHGVTVTCYLVSATATPNFNRVQKKHNLPFMEGYDPKAFPEGTQFPSTPEEVAAALFPQLEDGPRIFPQPSPAAAAERADYVATVGESSKKFFPSGLNELVD
jgi:short-subunit dehydrogenase